MDYKFTLAAIHEEQKRIEEKCHQQYLELLRDHVCTAQQEYTKWSK